MCIIPFIDVRVRLFRDWLSEEITKWLPPIPKTMLQKPILGNYFSHMCIVLFKAFTQCSTILPMSSAIISQDKDQGVCVSEEALRTVISSPV